MIQDNHLKFFSKLRVGQGYDCHALVPGRALIIGGVEIAHTHGLLGHSDADVLIHAIIDALLGAAGWGDIGKHFPDTDKQWKEADSRQLLKKLVHTLLTEFAIINIDATILAETPRLASHLEAMKLNLAQDLKIAVTQINLKAKTSEKLGFVGMRQGIAAQAVVLLSYL